jgi:hypothetical protein
MGVWSDWDENELLAALLNFHARAAEYEISSLPSFVLPVPPVPDGTKQIRESTLFIWYSTRWKSCSTEARGPSVLPDIIDNL